MAQTNRGIRLVVGVAVLGLLLAVPAISAHEGGPILDDEPTANDTDPVDEPGDWVTEHANAHAVTDWMNEHMEPGATEWMHDQGEGDSHHTETIHDGSVHAQDDHDDGDHVGGDHDEDTHAQGDHGSMHGESHGC